jgi:hypothetical protein
MHVSDGYTIYITRYNSTVITKDSLLTAWRLASLSKEIHSAWRSKIPSGNIYIWAWRAYTHAF